MASPNRQTLFESLAIPAAVARLAIPTMLSSLILVLYNLTDTYFVSLLNDPIQNAAVTLASPLMLFLNVINNLFGVGSSSLMSWALGQGKPKAAAHSSVLGLYGALLCAILLSLCCFLGRGPLLTLLGADAQTAEATFCYIQWTAVWGAVPAVANVVLAFQLRAEGAAFHASAGTISGCLLNVLLDPFFILPQWLDLGVEGAAVATFLCNCVACGYYLVLLAVWKGRSSVCLDFRRARVDRPTLSSLMGVGVPAAVQTLLNVTGMTILNRMAAGYGPAVVAAMGIAQKINSVPVQIALGFSQGIMPLVGYNYASGNLTRMKKSILFTFRLEFVFLILMQGSLFVLAPVLFQVFLKDPEVLRYGAHFLRGFCLALPLLGTDFLMVCVFQAVGLGKQAFCFAVLRKIVLEIPLLFLLHVAASVWGLAYAQLVTELLLLCVMLPMFYHTFWGSSRKAV